ncbi:hypothetical protein [Spiroplasma endosymbiont of Apeira syringaria]|uniref:hypothetical protein n=1 Tax=Spiroplasma endosymbiont of Apeira syringaria TaxID=3066307 RepID=UPI0030CE7835
MQDIAVQFEKHFWIHSVSLFPPQVHVGRSPLILISIKWYWGNENNVTTSNYNWIFSRTNGFAFAFN